MQNVLQENEIFTHDVEQKTEIDLLEALDRASDILPLVWPLTSYIASNPLRDFEALPFAQALEYGCQWFPSKQLPLSQQVNQELIKWCKAYLDQGQATYEMPGRERGFYSSWRALAPYDKQLHRNRKEVKSWLNTLPEAPEKVLELILQKLSISNEQIETFFRQQLAALPGWGGYVKRQEKWTKSSDRFSISLLEFLAVRLSILSALKDEEKILQDDEGTSISIKETLYAMEMKEKEFQSHLKASLNFGSKEEKEKKWKGQVIFCIDVRSELFRYELEKIEGYQTFGYAGFFGLPIQVHDVQTCQARVACPVLLKPVHQIEETPAQQGILSKFFTLLKKGFDKMKHHTLTPFALVETLGIWFGLRAIIFSLCPLLSFKKGKDSLSRSLFTHAIALEKQAEYALALLQTIGLTKNFAKWVILCGHKGEAENTPYLSALHCGACGGHPGGMNGQVMCEILNASSVRKALKIKGVWIPDETVFLGAEHNTTTDEVTLFSPQSQELDSLASLDDLKEDLRKAGHRVRKKRGGQLGLPCRETKIEREIRKKGANWSETRPEWGLAQNAGFLIGPRELSLGVDLQGRCFLHSYDWKADEDGKILEGIMNGPLVVGHWINMQYLFSSIDPIRFGSGSKVTQNVVGKLGVMQGNASDLMHGLPLESIFRNTEELYHQPLRLSVIICAPKDRVKAILEKHPTLKNLFSNQWAFLSIYDPVLEKIINC